MDERYKFATVFVNIENIHLIKDPGMIPFTMQNSFGFHSVVPLSSAKEYEYKNGFFKEIETPIIKEAKKENIRQLRRIFWIMKNAFRIDVLHLYFFDRWTWLSIFMYKTINKKGLVYVHCDSNGERLIEYNMDDTWKKRVILHRVLLKDKFLKDVLWGIQNKENMKILKGKWPFVNLYFIPNGVYWPKLSDCYNKENIIITVGRIGAKEKRTDLLLEAFAMLSDSHQEWRLRLVGPVEEDFNSYIDLFFERFPYLKQKIDFVGSISDRIELEREYSKAKIFCLPSTFEGFNLSSIEALSRGVYIVGSNIPSNIQITDNGKYGLLFENGNLDDFACKLESIINSPKVIDENIRKAERYACSNYAWEKALTPVYEWIKERKQNNN